MGLGLVLLAFISAQALGGDGFLAAFFAGLAVNIFDVSLCDCFLEYGEVTAEMTMLLAFLLFGVILSGLLGSIPLLPALALALATILLVRPLVQWLILQRAALSREARLFIGWFGPRGLSSLLLALLVVAANAPDAVRIFTIVGVVVLVSALAHGVTATPLAARYGAFVAHARCDAARGAVERGGGTIRRGTGRGAAHQRRRTGETPGERRPSACAGCAHTRAV